MVVKKLGYTREPSWMVSAKNYANDSQLQAIILDLGDVDNRIHRNSFRRDWRLSHIQDRCGKMHLSCSIG